MQIHCPIRARIYVLSVMSWVINNLLLFTDGILLEHILYTKGSFIFVYTHLFAVFIYLFYILPFFLNALSKKVLYVCDFFFGI